MWSGTVLSPLAFQVLARTLLRWLGRRAAQRDPAAARPREPRDYLDLSARNRQQRDHRHHSCQGSPDAASERGSALTVVARSTSRSFAQGSLGPWPSVTASEEAAMEVRPGVFVSNIATDEW